MGAAQPPLFLTHCSTGQLFYTSALTLHIEEDIPVYGLPCQREDDVPLRTIEGMAARMVHMIQTVQPVGPYRIAGWSFGGVLAFEIAAQLIGADQEVEFLGVFDTRYSASIADSCASLKEAFEEKEALLDLVQRVTSDTRMQQTTIDELKSTATAIDFSDLFHKCHELGLVPEPFLNLTDQQLQHTLALNHAYRLASLRYYAQQIPIPLHLFLAHDAVVTDSLLGWDAVMPKRLIRVVSIQGKHQSMTSRSDVKALGKAVSNSIHNPTKQLDQLPEHDYSPLVPLQVGRSHMYPFFCVPGAGSSVTAFVDLITHLPPEWTFFGLQPRGLDGALVPYSTVEVAATAYLRAIREICTKGPIHLIGHSFGGWVAFEIAQRLPTEELTVASLTILDSEAPDDESDVREYSNTDAIMKWLDVVELTLERPLNVRRIDLDSRKENLQRALLHRRLVDEGLLPRSSQPEILRGLLRTFNMSLRTKYTPDKVYPGPVRLVLVENHKLDRNGNKQLRDQLIEKWKRWAPNVTSVQVPGNHITVLKPPHVRALANLIRQM